MLYSFKGRQRLQTVNVCTRKLDVFFSKRSSFHAQYYTPQGHVELVQ